MDMLLVLLAFIEHLKMFMATETSIDITNIELYKGMDKLYQKDNTTSTGIHWNSTPMNAIGSYVHTTLQITSQEFCKDSKISIMPGTHAGKGCVINF
jgi:hypothetical protein